MRVIDQRGALRLGLAIAAVAVGIATACLATRAWAASEDKGAMGISIESKVVCAPGTHPYCKPGPWTIEVPLPESARVTVDVYLVHTGYYEPNEQSSFFSPLGDLLDCGPIPPDTAEVYCGQVSGHLGDVLPLTIEHSGSGNSTGSHRQRYEIKACEEYQVFFPIIPRN